MVAARNCFQGRKDRGGTGPFRASASEHGAVVGSDAGDLPPNAAAAGLAAIAPDAAEVVDGGGEGPAQASVAGGCRGQRADGAGRVGEVVPPVDGGAGFGTRGDLGKGLADRRPVARV